MDTVEAPTISIRKLAAPLGAEITGIDVGQPMSTTGVGFTRVELIRDPHSTRISRLICFQK